MRTASTTRCRRRSATIRAICRRERCAGRANGLYGVENESVVRDVAAACKGDYAYLFRTTDSYNGLDFALFYFGDRFFPDRVEAGHFWMTAAGELRGAGRV